MKKLLILTSIIILLSGCSTKTENKDFEAYCSSLSQKVCFQNEDNCEFCGDTKISSYASCHSKNFCKNTPME